MNTMKDEANLEEKLRKEVEAVHNFIAAWFRGDVAHDQKLFNERLADRFANGMLNIQPSGNPLSKEQLLTSIYDGHGSNKAFTIAIRDFKLLALSENRGLAVASYIEDQRNAKNSIPPDNLRISSVVFRVGEDETKTVWIHLHETAHN